jgi:hypothetical protein
MEAGANAVADMLKSAGVTVTVTELEVEPPLFPKYEAVMLSVPLGKADVRRAAVPPDTVAVPIGEFEPLT